MSKVYNNYYSSHMKALLFELNMLWREIGALENHLSFTKGTKTRERYENNGMHACSTKRGYFKINTLQNTYISN